MTTRHLFLYYLKQFSLQTVMLPSFLWRIMNALQYLIFINNI